MQQQKRLYSFVLLPQTIIGNFGKAIAPLFINQQNVEYE